ncbi:MAG: GlsB/YeaQ/YmgE family stress response membrane protein [Actinomycetes bacterium]
MILLFILVWGMFAGWIAHLLLARNQPVNWAELLVVGLAGSFVGGLLISLLSGDGLALRPSGIIGSILGAVVLLAAWQGIRGGTRGRSR